LQQDQLSSRKFQHTSLSAIQRWSRIKGDLFDNIIVFENYRLRNAPIGQLAVKHGGYTGARTNELIIDDPGKERGLAENIIEVQ